MDDMRNDLESFFAKMKKSFEKGWHTDVEVICGNGLKLRCHRLILAAASGYFDEILGRNVDKDFRVTKVILHRRISSHTFTRVLQYMYTGRVSFLSDDNVYHMLIASDILRLETIKEACRHYLSQKGVPIEWARKLLKFACKTSDSSLQSTVCLFLLKNKDYTIHNDSGVKPSELKVLLSYFRATSLIEEQSMVEAILKWTLPANTDTRAQLKLTFMNAVNMYRFKYLPQNYPSEYFEEMMSNDHPVDLRKGKFWGDFCRSDNYHHHPALLVFTQSQQTPLKLSTLDGEGGAWRSQSLNPCIDVGTRSRVRCTAAGDRLYWLSSHPRNESDGRDFRIKFYSSPIESFAQQRRGRYNQLPEPTQFIHPTSSLHVCSDERSFIYVCASHCRTLRSYNCELSQWFHIELSEDFFPRAMTWYDHRLYLFGGESPTSTANGLRTLDPRAGRLCDEVLTLEHFYAAHFECCSHRERLYLASFGDSFSGMVVFDPIARKAINIQMSRMSFDIECRLASFRNKLWTINCDTNRSIRVDTFDPYFQTFTDVPVNQVVDPDSYLLDAVVCKR